eukprot:TRINITY_DN77208_c0_g1_i1.p2 TRINITY_DN77208_c0_g1~~TRINITY_DN77208_c0_g1_i1.p2  ORF type:complete len:118 (-),score=21.80 TRINITY_DN77208_c0_g1_i1:265-618(-)
MMHTRALVAALGLAIMLLQGCMPPNETCCASKAEGCCGDDKCCANGISGGFCSHGVTESGDAACVKGTEATGMPDTDSKYYMSLVCKMSGQFTIEQQAEAGCEKPGCGTSKDNPCPN